jgi:hypothetical protein
MTVKRVIGKKPGEERKERERETKGAKEIKKDYFSRHGLQVHDLEIAPKPPAMFSK